MLRFFKPVDYFELELLDLSESERSIADFLLRHFNDLRVDMRRSLDECIIEYGEYFDKKKGVKIPAFSMLLWDCLGELGIQVKQNGEPYFNAAYPNRILHEYGDFWHFLKHFLRKLVKIEKQKRKERRKFLKNLYKNDTDI